MRFSSRLARALTFTLLSFLTTLEAAANPPEIWGSKFTTTMILNATGFVSWIKLVNPGDTSKSISADIIWTLADGTEGSVAAASLGTVDAGAIFTISEASILTAMGNPNQLADVFVTLLIANPDAFVHAEKKASDGRLAPQVTKTYVLTDPAS